METDWAAGQVIDALEKHGLAENTLVIFTADNGHCAYTGLKPLPRRRPLAQPAVPRLQVRHLGRRPPDSFHRPLAGQGEGGHKLRSTDLPDRPDGHCADLLGVKLPDNAGEDSVSILPALRGSATARGTRPWFIIPATGGSRSGRDKWKLELCPGSGGLRAEDPPTPEAIKLGLPAVQLYDMSQDDVEKNNVQDKHPDVVARLTKLLEKYVSEGRSTPVCRRRTTWRWISGKGAGHPPPSKASDSSPNPQYRHEPTHCRRYAVGTRRSHLQSGLAHHRRHPGGPAGRTAGGRAARLGRVLHARQAAGRGHDSAEPGRLRLATDALRLPPLYADQPADHHPQGPDGGRRAVDQPRRVRFDRRSKSCPARSGSTPATWSFGTANSRFSGWPAYRGPRRFRQVCLTARTALVSVRDGGPAAGGRSRVVTSVRSLRVRTSEQLPTTSTRSPWSDTRGSNQPAIVRA